MRRLAILGSTSLLIAISAIVTALVAQSAGASDSKPWPHAVFGESSRAVMRKAATSFAGGQVIVLRVTDLATTYVDNTPTGTSVGDQIAGEGTLVTLHGHPHGRLDFQETATGIGPEPNSGRLLLAATARLPHGQIDISGVLGFAQAHDPVLAITGGTQRYHAARGQVLVHAGPHRTRLTFRVTS